MIPLTFATDNPCQPCASCQRAVVACRCEQERADERNVEWWEAS